MNAYQKKLIKQARVTILENATFLQDELDDIDVIELAMIVEELETAIKKLGRAADLMAVDEHKIDDAIIDVQMEAAEMEQRKTD